MNLADPIRIHASAHRRHHDLVVAVVLAASKGTPVVLVCSSESQERALRKKVDAAQSKMSAPGAEVSFERQDQNTSATTPAVQASHDDKLFALRDDLERRYAQAEARSDAAIKSRPRKRGEAEMRTVTSAGACGAASAYAICISSINDILLETPTRTPEVVSASSNTALAVEHVKRVYDIKAAVSSKSQDVATAHKQAAHSAQFAASIFSDFFAETEPDFNPDAFFRACGMPEPFVVHMAKARAKADRKTLDKAWREAEHTVKAKPTTGKRAK